MTARTRDMLDQTIGTKVAFDGTTYTRLINTTKKHCSDTVGNFESNNGFGLQSATSIGGRLDGSVVYGTTSSYTFHDYPLDAVQRTPSYLGLVPVSYANGLRTQALARTGLSNPSFNIPLSVVELRDVPRMLRHAGDLLHGLRRPSGLNPLKEGAAATLAWQFGWRPLIDDLKKLMKFQLIVEKRVRQIDQAFDRQRGYLGKATLENFSTVTVEPDKGLNSSSGLFYRADRTTVSSTRSWCTVPWAPRSKFRSLGSDAAKAKAFNEALGFNGRNIPLTIWKALPWTWLTDWFVNISDSILAVNNLIDYQPGTGCIMVHRSIVTSFPGGMCTHLGEPVISVSSHESTREIKQRFVISDWGVGLPTMKVPFLDTFKLSVLGSLTILKIVR